MKVRIHTLLLPFVYMNSAASAFTVSSPLPTRTSSTTTSSSLAVVGSFTAVVSRRDFAFQTTAAAVAAFALGTALIAAPSVATAAATDVDGTDLAMPTLEQQQLDTDADAAAKAKLARKLQLQKKAAQPKNFQESFKRELEKEKEMSSQTKEQRRNAMCEELGRGC